ncbi:hypothetical protein Maes01_01678 [Microbulbifer aestuariivivens]|uniref:YbaK/aminoacyl-tRNA synthetase-associated domain-containing protein n=1 Tax=Microbulbifer aestuariivivens TaxID=1908308 RepID=A0ABP9WRB9_9GAMM
MTIAASVSQFLEEHSASYRVIPHAHSATSRESAHAAGIREDQVAKAILLRDAQGLVMAVIPASSSLDLRAVHDETGRNQLEMVAESELAKPFSDCELGALPPIGPAYGITTLVDSSLGRCDTVYFESGDHEGLVAMDGRDFDALLSSCHHADLSKDWP